MILPAHELVRARVAAAVSTLYQIAPDDPLLTEMPLETPPKRALGDVAVAILVARALAALGTPSGGDDDRE